MKKTIAIITILLLSVYAVACTSMGRDPSGQRLESFSNSEQYNKKREIFENKVIISQTLARPWYEVMYDFAFNGNHRRPGDTLPESPPGLSELLSKTEEVRFIWFGHSTLLLEIDNKRILIDPIFSTYASPIPGIAERFQPPVFDLDEIEDIDIVLISHDHYDHLDYETISRLKERKLRFIVPLGVGEHLEYWGINRDRIQELDWWDATKLDGLVFTCTPSQHFSGRGMFNRNTTLWSSWAIRGKTQNVYFSGDSGYSPHYKDIGDQLGPFDIAFLENGAYNQDWKSVHQLPEEGVQASIDLRSQAMVPIHWGMFDLSLHSWYEPIQRVTLEAEKKGVTIVAPKLGQLVSTKESYSPIDWWSPLIAGEEQ